MHRYNKQPIEIGRLQRHAMEIFTTPWKSAIGMGLRRPHPSCAKIACIGAGPASLACAAELRKLGYAVTLFEARQTGRRAEHIWRGGIQVSHLTTARARLSSLKAPGRRHSDGSRGGADITFDQLESEFDAISWG